MNGDPPVTIHPLVTETNSIKKVLNDLMIIHQMISRLIIHLMFAEDQQGHVFPDIIREERSTRPMRNNPINTDRTTRPTTSSENRIQVQLQMHGPLLQTLVDIVVFCCGAADHHEEDVGVSVAVGGRTAEVLDLHVVPELAFVVPAVFAGTDEVALPGRELGGQDAVPNSQDDVVSAGVGWAQLVDCLPDGVV